MKVFACRLQLTFVVFVGMAVPASAATIFTENFNSQATTTSLNPTSSATAWFGYHSATAQSQSTTGDHRAGIFSNTTGTQGPGAAAGGGYLYAQNVVSSTAVGTMNYLFFNTSSLTPFAPADYLSLDVTWKKNGNSPTHFFAAQVDDVWYLANTGYTSQTAPTFNLLTATWRALDFTAGSTLSFNPAGTVRNYEYLFGTGDNITGIGFYISDLSIPTSGTQTIRFDDLVISGEAIPEPSRSILFGIALAAGMLRRRR